MMGRYVNDQQIIKKNWASKTSNITTSTNLKSGPIPLYTIPTFLVTISILCMLFSSYRIDFCFFSVAKTTPLVAKKKLIKYIIFLEFLTFPIVCYEKED